MLSSFLPSPVDIEQRIVESGCIRIALYRLNDKCAHEFFQLSLLPPLPPAIVDV